MISDVLYGITNSILMEGSGKGSTDKGSGLMVNSPASDDIKITSVTENMVEALMTTSIIHEIYVHAEAYTLRQYGIDINQNNFPCIKVYIFRKPEEMVILNKTIRDPGPILGIAHYNKRKPDYQYPVALMRCNRAGVPFVYDGAKETLDDEDIAVGMLFYGAWYQFIETVWKYGSGPYPVNYQTSYLWRLD